MKGARVPYHGLPYVFFSVAIVASAMLVESKHEEDLARELAARVRENGLYVAEWRPFGDQGRLTLFPFTADPRKVLVFPPIGTAGWLAPDGRSIVIAGREKISIVSLRGTVLAERKGLWGLGRLALSSSQRKLAYTLDITRRLGDNRPKWYTQYYWGDFGSAYGYLIAESSVQEWDPSLGWAPDERRVVLSAGGEVRIYDTASREFQTVAKGSDPTWSPDGRYIAFRTPDRYGRLYELATHVFIDVLPTTQVLARLDWSPDSKYLLFSEEHLHWCGSTRLGVLRVKDLVTVPVLEPCFGWTNQNFGWVVLEQ